MGEYNCWKSFGYNRQEYNLKLNKQKRMRRRERRSWKGVGGGEEKQRERSRLEKGKKEMHWLKWAKSPVGGSSFSHTRIQVPKQRVPASVFASRLFLASFRPSVSPEGRRSSCLPPTNSANSFLTLWRNSPGWFSLKLHWDWGRARPTEKDKVQRPKMKTGEGTLGRLKH